jgi:hypothetical protein
MIFAVSKFYQNWKIFPSAFIHNFQEFPILPFCPRKKWARVINAKIGPPRLKAGEALVLFLYINFQNQVPKYS